MNHDLHVNLESSCKSCLSTVGNRSPPEMFFGELRDSASSVRLPNEDHSDSTNAMRSFRCAAVKALKLFLAVVA